MNKKETSIVHDAVILTIITLIAGLLLGLVHMVTEEPIARQQAETRAATQKAVFENADHFEEAEVPADAVAAALEQLGLTKSTKVLGADKALDASGNVLGYIIDVTNNEGYGGDIEIMVGVDTTGETNVINAISFLELAETAGMGMKCGDPEFKDQFNGRSVTRFTLNKAGGSSSDEEIVTYYRANFKDADDDDTAAGIMEEWCRAIANGDDDD
jgi:electron transport complex protein RnfG